MRPHWTVLASTAWIWNIATPHANTAISAHDLPVERGLSHLVEPGVGSQIGAHESQLKAM
jgi:hypothetical protein